MNNASIDPEYYGGDEPSGAWLTSAAFQSERIAGALRARHYPATAQAVADGVAEWVPVRGEDIPF